MGSNSKSPRVVIAGGGIAGLATALALVRHGAGRVTIIEQEKKPGGHASGRNAGMLRQALSDPVLARLAKDSRKQYGALSRRLWPGLKLKKNGSMILSGPDRLTELKKIGRALSKNQIPFSMLSPDEARKKVSALKGASFSRALFCPEDALLELEPLLSGFMKNLSKSGVELVFGRPIQQIFSTGTGQFHIAAGSQKIEADIFVNAAGAWAKDMARMAGASDMPLLSYRRHLFYTHSGSLSDEKKSRRWPFVWDIEKDFYFRPTAGGCLVSACDKTLERRGDRREKTDARIKPLLLGKMKAFSPEVSRWKVGNPKSGLRTMTPDGRFLVGEDPVLRGFFWVAGLGGHGVTTCFAVGDMTARLILGLNVDKNLIKAFSPDRFC